MIEYLRTQKETVTTYVTDSVSHELSRVLEATTTDKTGKTETILYTYGNGLVAQEKSACTAEESHATGEYLVYHFNHLGSTTAVTDEAGEIRYTYTYNIFGKLLSGNYGEVEFLYNGQYGVASDANGLYYMRARYYNIDIMRFINQDILTGSIDSSQSLNRYAYVEGNPVNFLDPFGLEKVELYTGVLHMFATILSGVGSFVGQFNPEAGMVIGVVALCFDMGVYINDIVTSGFDEDVIEEAAQSIILNAGFLVLGATATEIMGVTILVKNIYSSILNGTCVGTAMMSSAIQLTDYVLRILDDHETMEFVDYFYM